MALMTKQKDELDVSNIAVGIQSTMVENMSAKRAFSIFEDVIKKQVDDKK